MAGPKDEIAIGEAIWALARAVGSGIRNFGRRGVDAAKIDEEGGGPRQPVAGTARGPVRPADVGTTGTGALDAAIADGQPGTTMRPVVRQRAPAASEPGVAAPATSAEGALSPQDLARLGKIKNPLELAHELKKLNFSGEEIKDLMTRLLPEGSFLQLPMGIKIPLNKWTIGLGVTAFALHGYGQEILANVGIPFLAKGQAITHGLDADRAVTADPHRPKSVAPAAPVPPVLPEKFDDATKARLKALGIQVEGSLQDGRPTFASAESTSGEPRTREALRLASMAGVDTGPQVVRQPGEVAGSTAGSPLQRTGQQRIAVPDVVIT